VALREGPDLQPWEIAVAKKLVAEFRRRSRSLEREEFDDFVQECLAPWLEVRRKLRPDPEGPPIAYMARVLRNKLTDLVRDYEASKRGGGSELVSLDAAVGDADDAPTLAELLDVAGSATSDREHGVDRDDVRIDVTKALQRLTPRQRRVCAMLGEEGLSVKEAAARLGIPRGTLYEELKRIRQVFAEHGLAAYLRR
jgi:RNA polymerase sigma-70 factor (ECF subfamily)